MAIRIAILALFLGFGLGQAKGPPRPPGWTPENPTGLRSAAQVVKPVTPISNVAAKDRIIIEAQRTVADTPGLNPMHVTIIHPMHVTIIRDRISGKRYLLVYTTDSLQVLEIK